MRKQSVIVAYDISSNKTRTKVRKLLREWSFDNQKSVYECRLSEKDAEELFLQLSELLNHTTDRLLMAWLNNRRKIIVSGKGCHRLDKKALIIK